MIETTILRTAVLGLLALVTLTPATRAAASERCERREARIESRRAGCVARCGALPSDNELSVLDAASRREACEETCDQRATNARRPRSCARVTSKAAAPAGTDVLKAGQSLACGKSLTSKNKYFRLTLQCDGNLVVYNKGNRALWASKTNGKGGKSIVQQSDGNLVMKNAAGAPVWSTATHGNPGAYMRMQDDGNAVMVGSSWHTHTSANCEGGEICLYDNATKTGFAVVDTAQSELGDFAAFGLTFHSGVKLDNNTSSIFNNTDNEVCFWDGKNFTGKKTCLKARQKSGDVSSYKLSSFQASPQARVVEWAIKVLYGVAIPSINGTTAWGGGPIYWREGAGHGAIGPQAGHIDCGGFTRWVYALATKRDVLGGGLQQYVPTFVPTSNPMPGDLVFFYRSGSSEAHHVGVYVGGGQMIDSYDTTHTKPISLHPVGHAGQRIEYRHYTGW